MNQKYLQSEELLLRVVEPEDLEWLYQAENDSSIWWLGGHTGPYSRFMLRLYLESATGDIYVDKQLRLMVERKADGKIIGIVDLFDFNPRHNRAEVGILIFAQYRQHGYFRKVMDLLCRYASSYLHLHQLYAYIPVENRISVHAFDKYGFAIQHLLKEWIALPEGYGDVWLMQKMLHEA